MKAIIVYISVLLPLPIHRRTDNRKCIKQPNAAVEVIGYCEQHILTVNVKYIPIVNYVLVMSKL